MGYYRAPASTAHLSWKKAWSWKRVTVGCNDGEPEVEARVVEPAAVVNVVKPAAKVTWSPWIGMEMLLGKVELWQSCELLGTTAVTAV